MTDMWRRASPEEPLSGIPAETYNGLLDMLKDFYRKKAMTKAGKVVVPTETNLQIQNVSGGVLDQYSIVARGKQLVGPKGIDTSHFGDTVCESLAPAANLPFAVLQEPARNTFIVPARMHGETFAKVEFADIAHKFAQAIGDYEKLGSSSTETSCEIIGVRIPNTQLSGGIIDSDLTLIVDSSSLFPAPPFVVTIADEDLHVTAVVGSTWTATRGYHGTTATSHADNTAVTFKTGILWAAVRLSNTTATETYQARVIEDIPAATEDVVSLTLLNGAITNVAVTLIVDSTDLMPLVFDSVTGDLIPFPIRIGTEQMLVTDVPVSLTLTVTRAWADTTAAAHADNASVDRVDILLGSGKALLYRIVPDGANWDLTDSAEVATVYNRWPTAILEGAYVTLVREPFSGLLVVVDDPLTWISSINGDATAAQNIGVALGPGTTGQVDVNVSGVPFAGDTYYEWSAVGLIAAWSSVTGYGGDEIVSRSGKFYRCFIGNTNKDPALNPVHWREISSEPPVQPYPIGWIVRHNNRMYRAILANSNAAPPDAGNWADITGEGLKIINIPDAGPGGRGLLTAGRQVISGQKDFSVLTVSSAGFFNIGGPPVAGDNATWFNSAGMHQLVASSSTIYDSLFFGRGSYFGVNSSVNLRIDHTEGSNYAQCQLDLSMPESLAGPGFFINGVCLFQAKSDRWATVPGNASSIDPYPGLAVLGNPAGVDQPPDFTGMPGGRLYGGYWGLVSGLRFAGGLCDGGTINFPVTAGSGGTTGLTITTVGTTLTLGGILNPANGGLGINASGATIGKIPVADGAGGFAMGGIDGGTWP